MTHARPLSDAALRAALYAAVHRGTPGDVALHLASCAGARRVLELGCGAGRVAIPLARAGHDVVGVDVDASLLDIARARLRREKAAVRARVVLREGDMRALSLGSLRFERVILAHSTLYCMRDDDEVRALLRGVLAHLEPGGALVIDAYAADELHAQLDPGADDPLEEVARVRVAGRRWRVLERSDWDRGAQRLDVLYRHVPEDGGAPIDTTIVHRYLLSEQLETHLRAAGFVAIRVQSTPHLVALASRR